MKLPHFPSPVCELTNSAIPQYNYGYLSGKDQPSGGMMLICVIYCFFTIYISGMFTCELYTMYMQAKTISQGLTKLEILKRYL